MDRSATTFGICFAVVLTNVLAFVPSAAHFFELPGKMRLDPDLYFGVQQIYNGWALFGIAIFGAIAADLWLAFHARRRTRAGACLACVAALLTALSLAVFFAWTYPANVATANWTERPPGWDALRLQWEYSHAANAIIAFGALCCATGAALVAVRSPSG